MAQAELSSSSALAVVSRRGLRPFFKWIISWEDWITLSLLLLIYLSTARTIETAGWVRQMPSLLLVSFLAMLFAVSLARWRAPSLVLLSLLLLVGVPLVLWQVLELVPGKDLVDQWGVLVERLERWYDIVRHGGISRDPLPFTIIVTGLAWIGSFLAVWSVFRWQNAWLAVAPAGFAIFANLVYQPQGQHFPIILYVFGALLLLMRVNLLQQIRRWDSQGVPRPEFISLSFIHHTAWLALFLLLAVWFMPAGIGFRPLSQLRDAVADPFAGLSVDASRMFSAIRVRQVLPVHAFGSLLPLNTNVHLRDTIIMEVIAPQPGFLRGAIYDEYTEGGWRAGQRRALPLKPEVAAAIRQELEANAQLFQRTLQEITVKPITDRPVFFSLGQPVDISPTVQVELPGSTIYTIDLNRGATQQNLPAPVQTLARELQRLRSTSRGNMRDEDILRLAPQGLRVLDIQRQSGRVREVTVTTEALPDVVMVRGDTSVGEYKIIGAVSVASVESLRKAGTDYPQWVKSTYLQLPSTLPARVRELAIGITKDATNPYDKTRAIEDYLRQFPSDMTMPEVPLGQDAVDFFLFDLRRGHFDFHASAMVVLLRAAGIPARLAVGYALDASEQDETTKVFTVRERDAYAWPEVFFPGAGWIQFNPSPDRPTVERAGEDLSMASDVAPNLGPQLFEDILPEGLMFEDIGSDEIAAANQSRSRPQPWPWLVGAAAVVAALYFGARWAWQRGLTALPYPVQVWEKTMRLAVWAKIGPQPQQTPREYASQLKRRMLGVEDIDYLAEAYTKARFGRKEATAEEEDRIREAWMKLRNKLVAYILRWR